MKRLTLRTIISVLAAGLLSAALMSCAAQQKTTAATPAATKAAPAEMPQCALKVPGTSVTTSDVPGGIAIDMTTTGDVSELRSRVTGRAAYKKAHPQPMPFAMTGQLEEIPNGMRKIIRAVDESNTEQLRKMIRAKLAKALEMHHQ